MQERSIHTDPVNLPHDPARLRQGHNDLLIVQDVLKAKRVAFPVLA